MRHAGLSVLLGNSRRSAETGGNLFFDFAGLGDPRSDEDIKALHQIVSDLGEETHRC
jgi:hypothetical protein